MPRRSTCSWLLGAALSCAACTPSATTPPDADVVIPPGPAASSVASASTATPSASPLGPGEKVVFVADQKVDCEGEGPMRCLRVRERPTDEWRLLYAPIVGFEHEAGYAYELRVTEETVARPPADGASKRWVLVKIVSKTAAPKP